MYFQAKKTKNLNPRVVTFQLTNKNLSDHARQTNVRIYNIF